MARSPLDDVFAEESPLGTAPELTYLGQSLPSGASPADVTRRVGGAVPDGPDEFGRMPQPTALTGGMDLVAGLGGPSGARMTAPPEPRQPMPTDEPQGIPGSWANALIGLGMGLQGKVGDFYQMQQNQLQRQQELQQKKEQAKQAQFNQFFDQMSKVDKEYGDDAEKWEMAMRAAATQGNPLARTALSLGAGSKYRGQFDSLMPILQEVNGDLVKQYRTDPKSIPLPKLKANLDLAAKIQSERMALEAEQAFVKGIQQIPKENLDPVALKHLQEYEKRALEMEELRSKVQNIPVEQAGKVAEFNKRNLEMQKLEQELATGRQPTTNLDLTNEVAMAMSEKAGRGRLLYNQLPEGPLSKQDAEMLKARYPLVRAGDTLSEAVNDEANRIINERSAIAAGARVRSESQAKLDIPLGTEANQYARLGPGGKIERPTSSMTHRDAGEQKFVNIAHYISKIDESNDLKTTEQRVEKLESYAKSIIKADPGVWNIIKQGSGLSVNKLFKNGKMTDVVGANGNRLTVGEVASLYENERNSMMEAIQRSVNQIKGAGTEGDVQRGIQGLADKWDTKSTMETKFKDLKMAFRRSRRNILATVFGDEQASEAFPDTKQSGDDPLSRAKREMGM